MMDRMIFTIFSDPLNIQTIAFRLGLSFVLAFFIGYEREHSSQPAGLRTHILISLGAAVFMIVSLIIPRIFPDGYQADPTRIAAQIVTGIGFLGAGAILKVGLNVKGLTTAANMWVVCAVGMTVGAGLYAAAFILTAFALITLIPLNYLEKVLMKNRHYKKLVVEFRGQNPQMEGVFRELKNHNIHITNIDFSENAEEQKIRLVMTLKLTGSVDTRKLFNKLRAIPGLSFLEIAVWGE
jgi:putative Mg2+ transporter-C (MgtC) family protein